VVTKSMTDAPDPVLTTAADVVVVGSVNRDTTFWVERFPAEGETALAHSMSGSLGGKAANQALAAARTGARVVLIAAVGDDPEGQTALSYLSDHGVDVSLCVTAPGARTGMAHLLVDADGANQITVAPNANMLLRPERVASALARVHGARVMIVQQEVAPAVVSAAIHTAAHARIWSILNASPTLPSEAEIPAPDFLVVNRSEAEQLTDLPGADAEALARALVQHDLAANAVVTDGSRGAAFSDGRNSRLEQAPRVEAVDTTGAGDAFAGSLAAALARGDELREADAQAAAAGSRAVTQRGAQPDDAPPSALPGMHRYVDGSAE
jgi:ribokinase